MSLGIIELVLVFGAVLALAVVDLMRTRDSRTSMTVAEAPPKPRPPQKTTPKPARQRAKKRTSNGA